MCSRKLSVQTGDNLSHGLGSTGGKRDDVTSNRTSTTPLLGRRAIDSLLSGSRGVYSRHQRLDDGELVVQDFGKWRKAVGGARSIGYLKGFNKYPLNAQY